MMIASLDDDKSQEIEPETKSTPLPKQTSPTPITHVITEQNNANTT